LFLRVRIDVSDLIRAVLRLFQCLRQRLVGAAVKARTRIRDAQPPPFRVVVLTVAPRHGDAALARELHGVQDQILRDTADLHLIALDRKAVRAAAAQEQAPVLRDGAYAFAQLLQQGGYIDQIDTSLFGAGLQSRQLGDVVEQVMQRGHVAHEYSDERIARRFAQTCLAQTHRGIGNHAEIAAQVMCRLAPQVGPLFFQKLNVLKRRFQVLQLVGRLLLLEVKELRHALLDTGAAQRRPDTVGFAGGFGVDAPVALELRHHDFVQLSQLTGDFP